MKTILRKWLITAFINWIRLSAPEIPALFSKVLIFVPHPDDEIIGLGGLIQSLRGRGEDVYLLYFTDGENSDAHPDKELIKYHRLSLSEKILNELKIPNNHVYRLHITDGSIPRYKQERFKEVADQLKEILKLVRPNYIFAPHYLEVWPHDHIACFELAKEIYRSTDQRIELWLYWVWTWHNLRPWKILSTLKTRRINIKPFISKKKAMMATYLSPLSPTQIPWSGKLPKTMLMPFEQSFEVVEKYTK